MSTIVYQANRSCFEPQFIETTTIRLKLAPPQPLPTPPPLCHDNSLEINNNLDMGGWSFSQSLDKEIPYTHPLFWKSPSKLSDRSLELCTENLGSETGSEISESCMLSLSPMERDEVPARKPREQRVSRREKSCQNFPPPLTTISGLNSRIQVRQHREGGRLIIEAVEAPLVRSCLQAERSNGRLRLCFSETTERETEEDQQEVDTEDVNGNIFEDGVKMGIERFQKPRRCNEGSGRGNKRGFYNWEPFWVATS